MRREGRVRGKRSNKSRVTGRKRRDRWKRFAANVHINPACAEFYLQPSLKGPVRALMNQALDERWSAGVDRADADAVQVKKATVNNVIEAAMARMDDDGYGDEEEDMGETTSMACPASELARGAILAGDGADMIPAIEEAFHREFGIYENAVEGSNFSKTHFARRWGSVLSEESWSDVEFLESELESSEEDDDWCLVMDGEDYDVLIDGSQDLNTCPFAVTETLKLL